MYCNYCGRPLNPGEVCSCQQPQPQQYQPNFYNGGYFTTEPASPAIAILRKHGSSVLMLLTAIFYAAGIVLSIVSSFTMSQYLQEIMSYVDPSFPQEMFNASTVGAVVGAVFGNILNYVAIGILFSIYRNCKKPVDSYIKTGGLTFFKVLSIISIVSASILIFMTVIFGIVMIALGGDLAYEMEYLLYESGIYDIDAMGAVIGVIFGVFFFIMAGALVFGIIIQASFIKTINSLKKTCTTGEPAMKVSGFYAVMLIISAVFSLFSAFNFVAFLSTAAMSAATIMGAVLLFRVRKDMRELVMSTAQPSYMPPVYPQNDGPTAYYYNPQQPEYTAPVEPAEAKVPDEPVYSPQIGEPDVGETTVLHMPEVSAPVIPELEIPAEEPTAEPVAEVAAELVEEPAPPAEVICPVCGKVYSSAANFCVYCGAPNPNK